MRLVHCLIDEALRPAFLSMEPQPHVAALNPAVITYKQSAPHLPIGRIDGPEKTQFGR
jgi:hypothetical protein